MEEECISIFTAAASRHSSLQLLLFLWSVVELRWEPCHEFGASLSYIMSFRIAKAKE